MSLNSHDALNELISMLPEETFRPLKFQWVNARVRRDVAEQGAILTDIVNEYRQSQYGKEETVARLTKELEETKTDVEDYKEILEETKEEHKTELEERDDRIYGLEQEMKAAGKEYIEEICSLRERLAKATGKTVTQIVLGD